MYSLRTLVGTLLTVIILAACAFVPLRFLNSETPNSPGNFDEAAELTAAQRLDYYNYFKSGTVEYEKVEIEALETTYSKEELDALEEDLYNTFELLNVDDSENPDWKSDNVVYYIVAERLRLLELYYEFDGDWKNWITFTVDPDTHIIYYAYASSACLQNKNLYYGDDAPTGDPVVFATAYAELMGLELEGVSSYSESEGSVTAVFTDDEWRYSYAIDYKDHVAALIDIRLTLESIELLS